MKDRTTCTPKFRPWHIVERSRANARAPLARRNGGAYIPRHWRPKDDADEIVRIREWLRFLAYFESRVNRFSSTW